YIQLFDHVEPPDDIGVEFVFVFLILNAVILSIQKTLCVGTNQFAAVVDIVQAVPIHVGTGADAFVPPIIVSSGRKFVVNRLPKESPRGLVEAHDNPLIAFDFGVSRLLVVGTDEDFAAGDDRPSVGLGSQIGYPFDVLLRAVFDIPFSRNVFL